MNLPVLDKDGHIMGQAVASDRQGSEPGATKT